MINDLSKVQDKVLCLLGKYPETRDSDKLLWLAYNCIYNNLKSSLCDYKSFRSWLLKNDTPVFESISRARRKIQEDHLQLRGKSYSRRKEESEVVKDWSLQ